MLWLGGQSERVFDFRHHFWADSGLTFCNFTNEWWPFSKCGLILIIMSEEKTKQISREDFLKSLQKSTEVACLIVMQGPNKGTKYLMDQPEITIGRTAASIICLPDQSISRTHAKMRIAGEKAFIEDLGSSNGTFVNKVKLAAQVETEIVTGDMLQFGEIILKYLPSGEVEAQFLTDITKQAHVDAMTEAFNKGYLKQYGEAEFKKISALGEAWSVIFIDLDHFKKVNDTYGHAAGDYVLKEFAAIIRSSLRSKDLFARYGGEEFVLLLGGTGQEVAVGIADRLRKRVETHSFEFEGKRIPVTSSAGVCEYKPGVKSFDELLKKADGALYQAKQTGRNRVCTAE